MSPAGYWPELHAAIEAGADAVYFGLKHFTARAKVGFQPDELPEVMRVLHRRGVKGYVTFNSLVFDHELDEAAASLARIAEAGADAVILQDLGMVRVARAVAPGLALHASTQMSITSAEGVRLAESYGISRVVLARELSMADLRTIRSQTDCELEVFVHGALCVSYSGQCFSSEAWGGRSANRGQCAQACRLPYEMIVDGRRRPLGDARYLLSPGDLFALRQVPEIMDIGVSSLKIEGRYKDAEYVALTTRAYRQAVDEAWAGRGPVEDRALALELEQVYSRGMGPYFLTGTNHQQVVRGRAPRHRGVLMGRVTRVRRDAVLVEPSEAEAIAPLKPGDGVVFDAADWRSPAEPEEGGRVFEVRPAPDGAREVRFANGAVDFLRIRAGDLLWRTHDPATEKAARRYTHPSVPVRRLPVDVHVEAAEGSPLRSTWSANGVSVTVEAEERPVAAHNRALDEGVLRDQLGRLGGTPYELGKLTAVIKGKPFVPVSALNSLRREAASRLAAALGERRPAAVNDPVAALAPFRAGAGGARECDPRLHLLVRTPEQLEAAIDLRPASITLDYLELYGLQPSVERIRSAAVSVRVASPRILKPDEQRIVHFLRKLDCAILVRSGGLLDELRRGDHPELTGDFSLNAANGITAQTLLDLGLARVTPAHDLNGAQVSGLARAAGADRVEAVAYHHMPVFHTEHCVFCRFLSTGTSHKDCGHPCERHRVALCDEDGRAHPVMADAGCRNTVFGAEAQQAAAHLKDWLEAGIRHFRLEFVHESADQVREVAGAFRDALAGRLSQADLERRIRRASPQGITEGSLFVPAGFPLLRVLSDAAPKR